MSAPPPADAELLARARHGDQAARDELHGRHVAAARRFASLHGGAGHPDHLVDDAFERALAGTAVGPGAGAEAEAALDRAFRVHLFVALRRLAGRRPAHRPADGDVAAAPGEPDPGDPGGMSETGGTGGTGQPGDEVPPVVRGRGGSAALGPDEQVMVLSAYESLPERWQVLLWQTAVEGHQPRELGPNFGVSANAAAALAYRGREKLRQAYVEAQLQMAPRPECEPHRSRLVAYVRDGLGRRDQAATEAHIDGCPPCAELVGELQDIDRMLVGAVRPYFDMR